LILLKNYDNMVLENKMAKTINYLAIECLLIFLAVLTSCNTLKQNYSNTGYEKELNLVFNAYGQYPIGPYINVTINDKAYMGFFDTGNGNGVLDIKQQVIDELNLEIAGVAVGSTVEERYAVIVYNVPEFVIDNSVIIQNRNVEPMLEQFAKFYDVIIGLSAFDDYNILLSYKQQKIYLFAKNQNAEFTNGWTSVNLLNGWDKGLYFKGIIGNKEYIFCLDTGSSYYSVNKNNYYDVVLGKELSEYIIKENDTTFEISGRKFKGNRFYTTINQEAIEGLFIDLFLGYDFLRKYDVFIDKGNMKLYIER
jgi:hypothetical protein